MTEAPAVIEVDPHDEQMLRSWYDAMRSGAAEGRAAPIIVGYESMRASLREPNPYRRRLPFAAFDGIEVVGSLLVELPLRDNTRLAEIDVTVPERHRGWGFGATLVEHGFEVAAAEGRTTMIGEVYVPRGVSDTKWPGARFAARHGFVTQHREDHLVLDLAVTAPPAVAPAAGYTVVAWAGHCPPEHVDAFLSMRNAMARELPTGDLDIEPTVWDAERLRTGEGRAARQGRNSLVAAARHADGTLVGYSELQVPSNDPPEVYQEDTLVMAAHRGHGLGAVLKAHNVAALRAAYPASTRIHTWTAGVNDAMLHINTAFGFRPVETLHEVERAG